MAVLVGGVTVFFEGEDDRARGTVGVLLRASGFFVESVLVKEYAGLVIVTLLVVSRRGRSCS